MRAAREHWDEFWFAPTDGATLALVRIAFGAVMTAWTLSLAGDLAAFMSRAGIVGGAAISEGATRWSVLDLDGSDAWLGIVYMSLLVASVTTTIGWHTRASTAVVFVVLTSLLHANPYVFNSGDQLLGLLALYLMVAPSGVEWSLDRRRAARRGTTRASAHPAWPLRLIQLQVMFMYLGSVWSKLHSAEWRDGTAASYAVRLPDLQRFPVPDVLDRTALGAHVMTYSALAVETALVALLWPRRTRAPALFAGIAMHATIELSIRVGFFSVAVLTAYSSFVPAHTMRALAGRVNRFALRSALQRRTRRPVPARTAS